MIRRLRWTARAGLAGAALGLPTIALALGGCHASGVEREHAAAISTWRAAPLTDYVIDVGFSCECSPDRSGPYRVRVEGGEVVSTRFAPGGPSGPLPADRRDLSVEGLLDVLSEALRRDENVGVFYDARGIPTDVWITNPGPDGLRGWQARLVEPVAGAAEAGARRCTGASGSPTDVENEPAWRTPLGGTQLRVWQTDDSCLVRIDVITDFDGPAHCGWEAVRYLVLGDPVGATFAEPFGGTWYVRDPDGVLGDRTLVEAFATRPALPDNAIDTGFRQGATELWLVDGDQSAVYLRRGAQVERWPADPDPLRCE